MQGFGTIALFRSSRLLIERTECGEILVTQGNLTLRLDHSGLERLYDAFDPSPARRQMYDDQVLAIGGLERLARRLRGSEP